MILPLPARAQFEICSRLYTAVVRARERVARVGSRQAVGLAVRNARPV